jgi:eukaryotic-like serine/threonine-protein kinase
VAIPAPSSALGSLASDPPVFRQAYQSLFVVGRGGMGSVEVALERSADGYERVVALKRLLPESARNPRHKEMFLREARLAALLSHPNVVHAFAYGELCDELFLAMEYVEGEPLSRVVAAAGAAIRDLDPRFVARVLAEVCDGLHAAHELRDARGNPLNVVHRDVSPHNVIIGFDGQVKILDFGVAKFETAANHTRTGEVKGKMAYMSPEQALGEVLDRRSDLFSVGAVLFECLAGRPMWGRGTDLEIMRRLALEEPPRLDDAAPGIPHELVALHARLVARDRGKRPASARQVADELREIAGAPSSHGGVRALMQRLFADEAAERRRRLDEALERMAPGQAAALRAGLNDRVRVERTPLPEPVPLAVRPRRAGRRPMVAGLIVGLGIAAAIAVATMDPTDTSGASSPAAARGAGAAARQPAPIPSPPPATTATQPFESSATEAPVLPPPPPSSSPTASTPRRDGTLATQPLGGPSGRAAPRRKPPSPSSPAPATTLPDVDPTPF